MDKRLKGVLYISITALCWSLVVIALKLAVKYFSPDIIVWFRFALSFIILSLILLWKNKKAFRIIKKAPPRLIVAGAFLALNYLGILMGTHLTSPSTTQIIIQIGPLLFALYGFIIFKESFQKTQKIGLVTAILGLLLFYFEQGTLFLEDLITYKEGVIWTITAGSAWSVYALFQKKHIKANPENGQEMNLFIYGIPVLIYTILISFTNRSSWSEFNQQPPIAWALIIFLGVNTVVAYGFLSEGLKHIKAATASTIITLNPILTIIIMVIFTQLNVSWIEDERLTLTSVLGATKVIGGAILVVKGGKKQVK